MRLLQNPLALATIALTLAGIFAFLIVLVLMRHLRRRMLESEQQSNPRPALSSETFATATYQGVIQRLKEQEKELERLRQSERERATTSASISEAILSNLASGVLLFNTAGLVSQANAAARAILGYASPVGLHARDLFRGMGEVRLEGSPAEAPPSGILDALQQASGAGVTFRRLEADYVTPSGERRVLGITLSPVRGSAGESLGTACLVSDLTDIAELARQVRLQENMAALGEMSAGIAHEFKNSLATISGYAQMLGADDDPATVRQFAARIASETANLTRVVTDFLAFARPQELRREPLELRSLLEDCARNCNVELALDLPRDLVLYGDPTALRQAFSNLLRNSAEAAAETRVRVEVSAAREGDALRLRFADNGRGIDSETLSRIFLPFFTTKPQGTGLGLALVHRIVTEHGGTITAVSDSSGATFTLSFPAENRARAAAESGYNNSGNTSG